MEDYFLYHLPFPNRNSCITIQEIIFHQLHHGERVANLREKIFHWIEFKFIRYWRWWKNWDGAINIEGMIMRKWKFKVMNWRFLASQCWHLLKEYRALNRHWQIIPSFLKITIFHLSHDCNLSRKNKEKRGRRRRNFFRIFIILHLLFIYPLTPPRWSSLSLSREGWYDMMKKLLQCSLVKKRFGRLKNVEAKKIDQILLKFLSQPIARPSLRPFSLLFSINFNNEWMNILRWK